MKTLAILAYHKIGDPPGNGWNTWNYVSENNFQNQLEYLKYNNWKVINVDSFLEGIEQPDSLTDKSALITFDDGYRSTLNTALPILKIFSYPAIVFVPTAFVGNYNSFDADIFYEPIENICSWEELIELEINDVSIQSHGISHSHFSQLSKEIQLQEILESKQLIQDKIGKEVLIFSFPYGDNDGNKLELKNNLIDAGYKAAVLYGGSSFDIACAEPFALQRIAIGADTVLQL
jgi:peptidoglycan/xylan/chitin deacetylase (PgdA/CDA1 family)